MLYNNDRFPQYVRTAGKITIVTALSGFVVFLFAFVFDFSAQELSKVSAQTATTSLTVLNTPPVFTVNAYEVVESSTSSPTDSGDSVQWAAIGTDSNSAPYFLLICDTNASPTANAAAGPGSLGTAPPDCDAGATQWGVSASTTSGSLATVSTTTTESAPFSEVEVWYAWVCDDDPNNPRCNNIPVQGYSATNSSPFHVNSRPVFSANLLNDGPVDPGGTVVWNSTSTDPDTVGGEDTLYLIICNSNTDYNTTTNTCATDFIASTTLTNVLSDAAATYTVASIIMDDTYPAYGYIIDEHGHEASANPLQSDFIVNNVAPTVVGGDIDLNGGVDMVLTDANAGETTGFTLDFTIRDANSCVNAASSTEITGYGASVFRSGVGTTTCDATGANYDPNNCYDSGVATTTWDLSCSITSSCPDDASQDFVDYSCTFPLWFVADPTDNAVVTPTYEAENWSAGIYGTDDDASDGAMSTTSIAVELDSAPYISIEANEIAYGAVEPGQDTGTLSATSTALNIGNTGLDQEVLGDSMCGTYSPSTPCDVSATSTINDEEQQFASTSLAYNDAFALNLSSTTNQEVELDVNKTTSTSTPNTATTYWGIAVPASITLAGSYTGLNTFTAVVAETGDW